MVIISLTEAGQPRLTFYIKNVLFIFIIKDRININNRSYKNKCKLNITHFSMISNYVSNSI